MVKRPGSPVPEATQFGSSTLIANSESGIVEESPSLTHDKSWVRFNDPTDAILERSSLDNELKSSSPTSKSLFSMSRPRSSARSTEIGLLTAEI